MKVKPKSGCKGETGRNRVRDDCSPVAAKELSVMRITWGAEMRFRYITKKEPIKSALFCCLGGIRTPAGGTRIRRATITPQGIVYRRNSVGLSSFNGCKVMQFF